MSKQVFKMKHLALILLVGLGLLGFMLPSAEAGGEVNLGRMTCGEFLTLLQKDQTLGGAVLIWINGYASGRRGRRIFNQAKLTDFAEKLGEFCAANPKVKLLSAAEKIHRN